MKNILKLKGIMAIAFIVIACSPKKSEKQQQIQTPPESGASAVQTQSQQTSDLSKVMYVNALEGLRFRSTPDINGERIGLLPHLAEITVISEGIDDITIDNIRGKWVLMQYRTRVDMAYGTSPLEGWVFNGYLMDWSEDEYQNQLKKIDFELHFKADNEQKIIGRWTPGSDWYRYIFSSDGTYSCSLLETSYSKSGTWQVKDNSLFLSQIEQGDYEPEVNDPPLIYVYKFAVIGNDTLLVRNVNEEHELTEIFFRLGQ
jgi:hypothetical protein